MIIGIIPARGGSKGIPRKNIKKIGGKPLIYWTIKSALESELLDDFFVSTEDEEIAEITNSYGAKVIARPESLSDDSTTTLEVLKYHVMNDVPELATAVLLQCTSPVRSSDLIDKCIKQYKLGEYDSLATGFNCKFEEWGASSRPRQKIKGFFYDDGNVYVLDREIIINQREGMFGNKPTYFFTHKIETFEIDDEIDFWVVEKFLEKNMINRINKE